jgi:heat shock transcription factor
LLTFGTSFLDDGKNTELIRWSDLGDSFVVLDEDEFAKTLIPELFKHNNYASFVRQLNMYGFHKRVGLSDNSMKASERKNKSPSEYYNPYFKRGHPNLLWLINKPKGGTSTKKGNRKVKNEDGGDGDSDDEGRDGVEEIYTSGYVGNAQPSRAISAAPESGPLQRREMAVVQSQLADIQKQQGAISQAISRLRKDHNQLYQQAIAFQTLHDRHESSINAILTFLATVYNRSLDSQGAQSLAQMFGANGIPQDQHNQGNVVDIGDLASQQQPNPGNMSPHRRHQRLLMAPPSASGRVNAVLPTNSASTPQHAYLQNAQAQTGSIEELFENSPTPADSAHVKVEQDHLPTQGMNIINNTNARSRPDTKDMEFPEMLSHYENANGNSPLTSEQRSTMLNLIANTSSAPGSNNALVSPNPPQPPSLEDLGYTQQEIDELVRMQAEQEARLHNITNIVQPLSPSGSIPGLGDGSYFNGNDTSDPHAANLDLDQFLDSGAFYNGSSPIGAGDFNYDNYGDNTADVGESHFDIGMDGANDSGGRIVETTNSSEAATPPEENVEEVTRNRMRSPSKRRRKN